MLLTKVVFLSAKSLQCKISSEISVALEVSNFDLPFVSTIGSYLAQPCNKQTKIAIDSIVFFISSFLFLLSKELVDDAL